MIEPRYQTRFTIAIVLALGACGDDVSTTEGSNQGTGGASATSGTTTAGPTVGLGGVGTTGGASGSASTVGTTATTVGASATTSGVAATVGTSGAGGGPGTGGINAPGGYVISGSWQGYAWTAAAGAGSTIMPADFSQVAAGQSLCVSGSVGPLPDFSGVALLGVNLNQAMQSMAAPMTVVPTSNGLTITATKTVDSPLRVQIQGPNGATDANDRWCAPLTGSGGFVPWSAFNTKCWDGSGTAYARQPIVSVSLLVPGGNTSPVPFAFCLTSLADGTGGGGTGGAGGAGGGSGAGLDGGIVD